MDLKPRELLLQAFQKYIEDTKRKNKASKFKSYVSAYLEYLEKEGFRSTPPVRDQKVISAFIASKKDDVHDVAREAIEEYYKFLFKRGKLGWLVILLKEISEIPAIALSIKLITSIALIIGLLAAIVQLTTPISTNNDIVVTQTSERMPTNSFNVVVAGFGFEKDDGSIVENEVANDVSDLVLAALRDSASIDYIRGWRDSGVGHILSPKPIERETQAAQIAEMLNADVVLYGIVKTEGFYQILKPEFYLSAQFAALEPELMGADTFGSPVEFIGNSDDQMNASTELQKRLSVLRLFLKGLSLYLSGNFTDSRNAFEDAIQIEPSGLEVLSIFAGNAAIHEGEINKAVALYSQTLTARPNYARALIGRGIAFYTLATQTTNEQSENHKNLELSSKIKCSNTSTSLPSEPQLLLQLAERCYQEAERSTDKPETADIDVKTAFGLGQVYMWMSTNSFGNYWDEAEKYLQEVVSLYNAAEPGRQKRIQFAAAHAHAWLGLRLLNIKGNDVEAVQDAVNYYQNAVSLLSQDANREYNQPWIDRYTNQINALNDWLEERVTSISGGT